MSNKLAQILSIIIFSCFLHGASYSVEQLEFFKPIITEQNDSFIYKIDRLGGYKFAIDAKWINTTAQAMNKFNAIVFLHRDDETQSLSLTLSVTPDLEKGKPINVKSLIEKSLTKKGVTYSVISSRTYKIGDKDAEEVDVSLANNRMMYVIAMFYKDLSVTGNLGYKASDPSTKKDLVQIFESFKTE